jgi:hypothetical protein
MKITFKSDGGFAAIPGLSKAVEIDLDALEPEQRQQLIELSAAADFFSLPATAASPARARDARSYTLTIEDGGRTHTVSRTDLSLEAPLAALVARLQKLGKQKR